MEPNLRKVAPLLSALQALQEAQPGRRIFPLRDLGLTYTRLQYYMVERPRVVRKLSAAGWRIISPFDLNLGGSLDTVGFAKLFPAKAVKQ